MEMEIDTLGIHYLVVHAYIQEWARSPGSFDFLERITSSLGAFYHDYRNSKFMLLLTFNHKLPLLGLTFKSRQIVNQINFA